MACRAQTAGDAPDHPQGEPTGRELSAAKHGTINILLANRNGMVLVTDSRTTGSRPDGGAPFHTDNSPKLFQLDDKTVCSFAGFYSDPGPHGELPLQTPGIIASLGYKLSSGSKELSFDYKVQLLAASASILLSEHAAANEYASHGYPISKLLLLVAGYDLDGSEKTAKLEISDHGDLMSERVLPVGDGFLFLTAGIDDGVQARLLDPDLFATEVQLKDYHLAYDSQQTAHLSLDQMRELARYLEGEAASFSVVGGPIQEASLSNGNVKMNVPNNLEKAQNPYTTLVLSGGTLEHSGVVAVSRRPVAYVNDSCMGTGIVLDHAKIIAGKYQNCNFYFDGERFYRDPNVQIISGKLIFGPDMTADNYLVKEAAKKLPELTVISYKELPPAMQEFLQNVVWPDFNPSGRKVSPSLSEQLQ
jgi:hypothetical protein